ncbi:MAG: ABC transporter ATP-binding protein [Deltaproteobacteria bacterium]|nr:ABC transporter ATP-binding protein [Deltaproteobacteria bacterium]
MSLAISLQNIRMGYGHLEVLAGLSLHISAGETLVLVGPSGSGKSTALRVILGLVAPDGGVVRVGDETVTEGRRILVPPERRGLAVVFQDLALWPHLTVEAHLDFGLRARKIPREVRVQSIRTMLERVGLGDKTGRFPGELSGGEQQRVAIARALVHQPRAILLDEPLTNLDVVLRADLVALLRTLVAEKETTALYVTHEIREAVAFNTRIAVLEEGRIVADGPPGELASRPPTPFVRALFADSGDIGAE